MSSIAATQDDRGKRTDVELTETGTTTTRAAPVRLPQALWDEIARHGEETFPDECCGALLGREEDGVRVVDRLLPIDNVWDETERRRRFMIDGRTVMRVEKDAAREGLLVLGYYHSHPDAPARPSEFDREWALPWNTYLIASIRSGHYDTLTGWQLKDDRSGYDEVEVRDA